MTTEFSQLTLHPTLIQTAADLGFKNPTEVQTRVIPLMLEGKDVLAQSQTGSGKTAAFAFPILNNLIDSQERGMIKTLVLTPTRELAIQVAEAIKEYGRHQKVSVLPIYGGQHYGTSRRRLKEGVDVIVGTPGRLQDLINQKMLNLSQVDTVILDEADEMLSMGFVDDVENILQETPPTRQTTLFSATLPQSIRRLADKYMHDPETIMVERKALTVDTIDQRYYVVKENDKLAALIRLFEAEEIGSTLVFTKTRIGSGRVANDLIQRGFPAEALNGDLSQDARIRVLNRFKNGNIKVLVATDVAARGLDIDDISHVINYDIPTDPEAYVHRIGRTGRAGKTGIAISLFTPKDKRYLSRIEGYSKHKITQAQLPTEKDLNERRDLRLLEKMEVWLERDRCKREQEIAEYLVASGHDPIKVAAAAIKMARGEEKKTPIEKISEVQFHNSNGKNRKKRSYSRNGRSNSHRGKKSSKRMSHESGMIRLSLERGRTHGINPGEIVGGIASLANIPGSGIGKISIFEKYTHIDIQEEYVSRVLGKTGSYHFRDQHHVMIKRAVVFKLDYQLIMKTHQACIPCISSLIELTLEKTELPESEQAELFNQTRSKLIKLDRSLPPACIAGESYLQILNASKQEDIYLEHKKNSIQEALNLYPRLKQIVSQADNQIEAAIRISALGNILDIANPNGYDLDEELEKLFRVPLEGQSLKDFQSALRGSSSLLILADNAAETVFDRVLIESLDLPVVYAVKSGPAFDDALITDAANAGISEVAELIATGTIYPGTYLPSCSPEFKELFNSAPLILAKGQANYETLSDIDRDIFFLLKIKCEVVKSEINFPLGSLVLKHHRGK